MSKRVLTLNEREKRFIDEYLVDFNATAALRRVGVKSASDQALRQQAFKLLQRERVQAELARRRQVIANKTNLTTERIVQGLLRIAEADVRKCYDEHGSLKPIHEFDDDTAAAIAGVEAEDIRAAGVQIGAMRKVKRFDAVRAYELLGRIAGSFNDTLTLKGDFADRLVKARERSRQARS